MPTVNQLLDTGAEVDTRVLQGLLADGARVWKTMVVNNPQGQVIDRILRGGPETLGPSALIAAISAAEGDETRKAEMTAITQRLFENPEIPVTPSVRHALLKNDFWHYLVVQESSSKAVATIGLRVPDLMSLKDRQGRTAYAVAVQRVKEVRT